MEQRQWLFQPCRSSIRNALAFNRRSTQIISGDRPALHLPFVKKCSHIWPVALKLGNNMTFKSKATAALFITAAVAGGTTSVHAAKSAPMRTMSVDEKLAESVWKLRAALNVAALQCQFDPNLKSVANYNQINKVHKTEIDTSRATLEGYYRKQYGRGGLNAFDKYNTKLWNGFSSVNFQVPFCQKTSEVATEALALNEGGLAVIANNRVSEILAIFPAPVKATPVAKTSTKKKSTKKKRSTKKK
jgi:hypothetical protein